MVSKKGGLVITILGVLSLLLSVVYMSSCTRTIEDNPWSCNYVYCSNGGRCDSGSCHCPVGYEGTDCGIASVDKFIGYWQMRAINIGSDSANWVGRDSTYPIQFDRTATNTTIFLNNYDNNANYNNIVCLLDSIDKNHFNIDTTSGLNMIYDHYRIRGGFGDMYGDNKDSVTGKIYIRHLNATVNWQNDTIIFFAKKR